MALDFVSAVALGALKYLSYFFVKAVWVEINGVIGSARARLQLISDPPL